MPGSDGPMNKRPTRSRRTATGGSPDVSRERKRTEKALRENEEALRIAQEIAHLGHWRYAVPTGEIWWSDELYRIFGLDRGGDPLTLAAVLARVHPDDRDAFRAEVTAHRPFRTDYRIVTPGGTVRHIHEEIRMERDAGGAPTRIYGTAQDITGRKDAEEALKASEEKYKFLIEATRTGYVIIDGEGRVADANAEYVRMSGHERLGDILGRSVSEWTAEHDRARNAAEVGKCLATGSVRNLEVDYVHGDGRVVPIELSATVTHADGGVRISTICRDISERRESERRLLESESRYRGLFESATDGIFVLDPEGNLIDANPVAYERLGYTRQELLSMNIRQLDQPEFADKVPERLALLRERGAAMFESAHRRKDGSLMPVEVNSRALDLAGGKVYFSIIRDIADRKLAEEALSEQRTLLQQILDTASVAIFLVDKEGRITHANRRMAEMFACAPRTRRERICRPRPLRGTRARPPEDARAPGEQDPVGRPRAPLPAQGRRGVLGHLTGRRFHDVHGNETGLIGVISDVSARRHAEEALRKSEKCSRRSSTPSRNASSSWTRTRT